jgi:glycerophosphoryl diester phosphodiesterase
MPLRRCEATGEFEELHMIKRLIAGLLATAVALSPAAAAGAAAGKRPIIVAHRGGALLWPENTLPAFDKAVEMGVDMLEFDMQMTADDRLVITHDGTVNASFCSAPGVTAAPVRFMTLAQVRKFDCGAKHRAIYPSQQAVPGTHMPTPDEFFARYKGSSAQFFGEIKMPGKDEGEVDPVAFARLVAAAVKKAGVEDRFILQSSDYRAIDAMHQADPRIRTCLLSPWRYGTDFLEQAREHHASCMLLRLEDADAAKVKQLQAAGIMVFSQVIDDQPSWAAYLARGDDALFTNDPKGLMAFLKRNAPAN